MLDCCVEVLLNFYKCRTKYDFHDTIYSCFRSSLLGIGKCSEKHHLFPLNNLFLGAIHITGKTWGRIIVITCLPFTVDTTSVRRMNMEIWEPCKFTNLLGLVFFFNRVLLCPPMQHFLCPSKPVGGVRRTNSWQLRFFFQDKGNPVYESVYTTVYNDKYIHSYQTKFSTNWNPNLTFTGWTRRPRDSTESVPPGTCLWKATNFQ